MKLAAITPEQFSTQSWRRPTGYAFTTQSNIIPVVVAELAKLVPAMPLGFVKMEDSFQLVAITSLQPGINLFVAPDGSWIGDYIPATVRAYPFQMVKPQDRDEKILCFDTDSGLLGDAGQGEAFFGADGPSSAVKDILNLLSETEKSRELTQKVVDALQAAELIQPWSLNLQQGEQTMPVEGLHCVDEAALNALPDDAFLSLRKTGGLALAYAQLLSMNQLGVLSKLVGMQVMLKKQLQAQAQAASQQQDLKDFGFRLSDDGAFKF